MANFANGELQTQTGEAGYAQPLPFTKSEFAVEQAFRDGNPPVIEILSPLPYGPGSPAIANTTPIVFRASDPDGTKDNASVELSFNRGAGQPAQDIPAGTIVETAGGTAATGTVTFSRPGSAVYLRIVIPKNTVVQHAALSGGGLFTASELVLDERTASGTVGASSMKYTSAPGTSAPNYYQFFYPFATLDTSLAVSQDSTTGVVQIDSIGGGHWVETGTLRWYRNPLTSPAGTVPAGTILRTATGLRYITTSVATFTLGGGTATASVRCLTVGTVGNVAAGAISSILSPSTFDPTITVSNLSALTNGTGAPLIRFATRATVSWILNDVSTLKVFADALDPTDTANVAAGTLTVIDPTSLVIPPALVTTQSITVTNALAAVGGVQLSAALERVVAMLKRNTAGAVDGVFDGASIDDDFLAGYQTNSTIDLVPGGFVISVLPDTGKWTDASISLRGIAYDHAGNEFAPQDFTWTVTDPFGGNPPVWALVSPPAGSTITPITDIVVDITDVDDNLERWLASFRMGTLNRAELVDDDDGVLAPYAALSTVADVTHGKRLTLARAGGWPDPSLTFKGLAYDLTGLEGVASWSWTVSFPPTTTTTGGGSPIDILDRIEGSDTVGNPTRARDINIDATLNNFTLTDTGDIALVGGVPSIAQACRQAIRAFLGEWFLDESVGVDWWGRILIKNPDLTVVRAALRDVITGVPGIADITTLNLSLDVPTRVLTVIYTATSDTGELVVDTLEAS